MRNISFNQKNINQNRNKKLVAKKVAFVILLAFFVLLELFSAVRSVSLASDYAIYEKRIKEINEENFKLKDKIAKKSSLTLFEEKSKEMGFVKPKEKIYVKADDVFALLTK